MLAICTVKDPDGLPVPGVSVDIWQTDSSGHYDVQYPDRYAPSERGIMLSDQEGRFWFQGIKPASHAIPHGGPVGQLLKLLQRHSWRPAQVHFMFHKDGWDRLITQVSPGTLDLLKIGVANAFHIRALYLRGDPYENSDVAFGVKPSLVVELDRVDRETAEKYGVHPDIWLLKYDFVFTTRRVTERLRNQLSLEAFERLGLSAKIVDGLPVPDLD